MRTAAAHNTGRLYQSAQQAFVAWCADHNYQHPVTPKIISAYLRHLLGTRGPSAVALHTSAIANLYRSAGWPFDTKSPPIQRILANARQRTRRQP